MVIIMHKFHSSYICAILITLTSAIYNEDPCIAVYGECRVDTSCPVAGRRSGLCPTQAYNVKCCVTYAESACSNQNGVCQWDSFKCDGYFSSGLCPTQPSGVRCCISNCGDKYEHALNAIFNFEGGCQNNKADTGNFIDGRLGYTCMGITPGTGWVNKDMYPSCVSSFTGSSVTFVKFCYDRNKEGFKSWAKDIYRKNYLSACSALAEPAFFVCSDIAVMSGKGRSQQFISDLGAQGSDVKAYATKFNDLHRQFLKKIVDNNPTKAIWLDGWLRRAADRDTFIQNYRC